MLTKYEEEVFESLTKFVERDGVAPALRELGDDVGIAHITARKVLIELEKKGLIQRIPRRARAIRILKRPDHGARVAA